MHELGIVFHILDSVKEVAQQHDVVRVTSVTLEIGEVSGIVPDYLHDCWKWACNREDMMRGCTLEVEQIPAITYCEACEQTYATVPQGKTCPYCASGATYLVQGNETLIKEIEVL